MLLIKDVWVENKDVHVQLGDEVFAELRKHRVVQDRELVYKFIWEFVEKGNSLDLKVLPKELLALPLILNIAPIVWRLGLNVEVEVLDSEFEKSLKELYLSYRRLWKELPWPGSIRAQKTSTSEIDGFTENAAALFSFGADSVATYLRNKESIKYLVSIVGGDVSAGDNDGVESFKLQSQRLCERRGIGSIGIQTNFKNMLNYSGLSKLIPLGTDWWTNFQHGPALVGYLIVLCYAMKCRSGFISATHNSKYLTRIGSRPDLEAVLHYGCIGVDHDAVEITRQQKLSLIGPNWNDGLHVCWKSDGFRNCGVCHKCAKTILGFLVLGDLASVSKYFPDNLNDDQIKNNVLKLFSDETVFDWGDAGYFEDIKNHLLTDEQYRNDYSFTEKQLEIIALVRDFDPYQKFYKDLMAGYEKEGKVFFNKKKVKYHATL